MALKPTDYRTEVHNTWCPGCGDFGILSAAQMAMAEMALPRHKIALLAGIGCSGKSFQYINTYSVHTLHGRVLPFATGVKLAKPELEVIAVGGDGDGLGIGAGHFVGAGRRNLNITYLLYNNSVYGLTKGQASPTLKLDSQPKSLPKPNINEAVNPIFLALASGFTFIARAYAYDLQSLKDLIIRGVTHNGSAFLDILQPCPTYDNINTKEWYSGEDLVDQGTGKPIPRIYNSDEKGFDGVVHNPNDPGEVKEKMKNAFVLSMEDGDRIPIGVFYQNEHVPTFEDRLSARIPNYFKAPPGRQMISGSDGVPLADISDLFEELAIT